MSVLSKKLNQSFKDYESFGTKQTISLTVELGGPLDIDRLRANITALKNQFKDIYFSPIFTVTEKDPSLEDVAEIFSRGQKVPLEFHLIGRNEHYFLVGLYHHSFCDGLGGLEVFRRIVEPGGDENLNKETTALLEFENDEQSSYSLIDGLRTGLEYIRAKGPNTSELSAISGERKVRVVSKPIKEIKALKNRLGCTVNELYLYGVSQVLMEFYPELSSGKILVPVNLRPRGLRTTLGNFILVVPVEAVFKRDFDLIQFQEISRQLGSREVLNAYRSARTFVLKLPRFLRIPTFKKLAQATSCIATYVPDGVTKRELCGAKIVNEFGMPALLPGHELGFCLITTKDEFSVGITLAGRLLEQGERASNAFSKAFSL